MGCTTTSLAVKLYRVRNEYEGVRRVSNGVETRLRWNEVEGWYCMSPPDMQAVVTDLKTCRELCK